MWADRCMWKTCEQSLIEEDLEVMEHLVFAGYTTDSSQPRIDNLHLRNKKNIIKQNNWAIWSFNKTLFEDLPKVREGEKSDKADIAQGKDTHTVDTLCSNSPSNYNNKEENKISRVVFEEFRKNKFMKTGEADSDRVVPEFDYKLEDGKRYVVSQDNSDYDEETLVSPLPIVLPFCKHKTKHQVSKNLSECSSRGRRFKPVFKVTKLRRVL